MCKYWIFLIIYFHMHHVNSENVWLDVANHSAWSRLDTLECGFSANDRIIGGLNAALGQFPWVTRLGYSTQDDNDFDWMCGGALITDLHLVTAAHCVQTEEDYQLTVIRMGEYNTETDPDCKLHVCAPPVQDRRIRAIRMHPNFNKPPFHNDVAIIEMDKPVQLNEYVSPICLPHAEQLQTLTLGELLIVAGWGKMNMTTEERARILQYVSIGSESIGRPSSFHSHTDRCEFYAWNWPEPSTVFKRMHSKPSGYSTRAVVPPVPRNVPVMKPETCSSFVRGFKLLQSEICAGAQQNKDACGGDSGGPLMKIFDTPDGPKTFLMGVVSFGPTICGIRKPGIYTSVPHFLKWILDNIVL